jgi:hypothetical protein
MEQMLGEEADFGMGLGIHGSPSLTDHRAGRGEPISSDQAVTTAGTVVNRLQLSLGMRETFRLR